MIPLAIDTKKSTQKNLQNKLMDEMQIIKSRISKASGNGDFSTSVPNISKEAKDLLEEKGYTVNQRVCGIFEIEYVIRWN